ncbi:unnamed protein product [Trypanosoma congolense IL3000]|uniref:WGS project CAEQ00000000 data, annotated contig 2167 n=1 Tax=Trypanosoma congolense (strain IL3000) TaxID=1068625 RepID=F9WC03_TRYCI|nr:unnamed protein product [Trypanosoma congolense IL3000]
MQEEVKRKSLASIYGITFHPMPDWAYDRKEVQLKEIVNQCIRRSSTRVCSNKRASSADKWSLAAKKPNGDYCRKVSKASSADDFGTSCYRLLDTPSSIASTKMSGGQSTVRNIVRFCGSKWGKILYGKYSKLESCVKEDIASCGVLPENIVNLKMKYTKSFVISFCLEGVPAGLEIAFRGRLKRCRFPHTTALYREV